MKAINFSFMSYPSLPDDFTEQQESVWLNFDRQKIIDPTVMSGLFNRYLDELEYAEEVGFDALCVNEHHGSAGHLSASPMLLATALARRTTRAVITVLGTSLALYNPPLRCAEEYAMLDLISGGRVIAGFPVGTPMDGPYAYSVNPSELRDRYHEAHDLVLKAWTANGPFEWNGRYNQLRYANPLQPLQNPHPPVWIPGGGSVETWDFCAANDYVYCYLTHFGYLSGAEIVKAYWNKVAEYGKDPNPHRLAMTQFVGVAESRKEAFDLYREPAGYFFRNMLHISPKFLSPPGYASEVSARKAMGALMARAAATSSGVTYSSSSFEQMVDNGGVIIGSPTEVTEQLVDICREGNIGNLITLTSYGNMSPELARYNTGLFGKKVLPELRKLHADWEHPYWPQGGQVQ